MDIVSINNNTVNINSSVNYVSIYGGYSVLSNAMTSSGIVPKDKILSSPISMSGNTVNVNAQCEVGVYGAYLSLDPNDSNPITVTCPINMDNNTVNINSSAGIYELWGAYVGLRNDYGPNINIPIISMSGNTINISSVVYAYGSDINVYAAYAQVSEYKPGSSNISTVSAANNTIIISKSDLSLPNANLYGAYVNVYGSVGMYDVHDNALYVNNAKNVSVNSIYGFDAYRFDLPNNVNNNDTVLTINEQYDPVVVDAQKISINNYDHQTSTLNVFYCFAYSWL
ncbi:MAG: hypothetical protein LBC22_04215 [Endomicrobium sp.]|nr:hypothetical protein [Endomicrobium sp.]